MRTVVPLQTRNCSEDDLIGGGTETALTWLDWTMETLALDWELFEIENQRGRRVRGVGGRVLGAQVQGSGVRGLLCRLRRRTLA